MNIKNSSKLINNILIKGLKAYKVILVIRNYIKL